MPHSTSQPIENINKNDTSTTIKGLFLILDKVSKFDIKTVLLQNTTVRLFYFFIQRIVYIIGYS